MKFRTVSLSRVHKDLADFWSVRLTPCLIPRPISGTGTLDFLHLCASGFGRSFTRLRAYLSQEDASLQDSYHTDFFDKTAEMLRGLSEKCSCCMMSLTFSLAVGPPRV